MLLRQPSTLMDEEEEAVNKAFYGFSQYMCNSVEVVKKNVGPANV